MRQIQYHLLVIILLTIFSFPLIAQGDYTKQKLGVVIGDESMAIVENALGAENPTEWTGAFSHRLNQTVDGQTNPVYITHWIMTEEEWGIVSTLTEGHVQWFEGTMKEQQEWVKQQMIENNLSFVQVETKL